ncbi:hypothetical protein F442_01520 [Phytophthora nicotianae P10297]|uniref:Uncharacterized protein n=1 Tax=Phytophthora nicotianae P10297 TaxID=1317064 RepID=W3A1U1_PHYNI|nr:hypothetical protein F442_01520 [Phytophthora nicotianae P10297]
MARIFAVKSDDIILVEAMVCASMSSDVDILEVLLGNSSHDLIEQAILKAASGQELATAEYLVQSVSQDSLSNILDRVVKNGLVELIKLLIVKVLLNGSNSSMIEYAENLVEAVKVLQKRASATQAAPQIETVAVTSPIACKRARLK